MNGEGIPPSVRRTQENVTKSPGSRPNTDEQGMLRIRLIVLFAGVTTVFILFAVFVNWIWWIPTGIFIFMLVTMTYAFLMMRRELRP